VELGDPRLDRRYLDLVGRVDDSSDGGDETFEGDAGMVGNGDRPEALHVGHGLGEAS
jgi:hypothetical protein